MPTSSDPSGKQDARRALLYLEAARRVLGPKRPGAMPDIEMMSSPVSLLIAHAVELALGAKLRSAGSRGGQGHHDLAGRLASVQELGFVLPARFQSYVRGIAPGHDSHQFRYFKGDKHPFVDGWQALEIVTPVVEQIEREVAAHEPRPASTDRRGLK